MILTFQQLSLGEKSFVKIFGVEIRHLSTLEVGSVATGRGAIYSPTYIKQTPMG